MYFSIFPFLQVFRQCTFRVGHLLEDLFGNGRGGLRDVWERGRVGTVVVLEVEVVEVFTVGCVGDMCMAIPITSEKVSKDITICLTVGVCSRRVLKVGML